VSGTTATTATTGRHTTTSDVATTGRHTTTCDVATAPRPALDPAGLARRLEEHRTELTAHCLRVLGSASEVDDAVQETLVRAWRSYDRFEGRASLRTWLHRIATNVCFDMAGASQRRARPTDPTSWASVGTAVGADRAGAARADAGLFAQPTSAEADPAEQTVVHETVRLALAAALLHLPPRQRSVLLLREVLRWSASEVAELLDTTVPSVNSALQRARSTLATTRRPTDRLGPMDADQQALLERFVAAFRAHDVGSLVTLLQHRCAA
jgi:RNA polymerase sigma-70 factor, ECF subfamily